MIKKILALIILDQVTKAIFAGRDFFIGLLHVHAVNNRGLSFSLNFGDRVNLTLVILVLAVFVYYYWRFHSTSPRMAQLAFALIFAGAISNIFDRLYFGFVRDFLDFGLKFTFNLADVFLVVGLLMLLLSPAHS